MLRASQLASMQATINRALPDSVQIQRPSVANVGGEDVETWVDVATIACRITHVGGGEVGETGGRIAEETTHLVTVPAGTDVEETDRLIIGSITYLVTRVRKRGAWELSRRVEVKEAAPVDG